MIEFIFQANIKSFFHLVRHTYAEVGWNKNEVVKIATTFKSDNVFHGMLRTQILNIFDHRRKKKSSKTEKIVHQLKISLTNSSLL